MRRHFSGLMLLSFSLSVALAFAVHAGQTSAPSSSGTAKSPATTGSIAKVPATSSLNGVWIGQVKQTGRAVPYQITLVIDGSAATSSYPQQSCSGSLTRIGSSGPYTFYSEKITKGGFDPTRNSGCLDGTLVLMRTGSNVLMSWFGALDDSPYQASATLARLIPAL
jgi:hypothetical protein